MKQKKLQFRRENSHVLYVRTCGNTLMRHTGLGTYDVPLEGLPSEGTVPGTVLIPGNMARSYASVQSRDPGAALYKPPTNAG